MLEQSLSMGFRLHETLFKWVSGHSRILKIGILMVAHASLLGFLFPEARNDFGEMALNLLIVILFLSPVAAITRMPLLRIAMGFRRELGILMGYLAMVHGLGHLVDPSFFDLSIAPYLPGDILSIDPFLLFGAAGLVLTFPLLLTSNALALRALGGVRWKRLHRIVYPMFVFAVLHRSVGPEGVYDDAVKAAQGVLLLGGYSLLKFLVWKPESFPLLRTVISSVGARYGEHSYAHTTPNS